MKKNQENQEGYRQPICPECNSKTVQARIRTDDYWCRRCGYIGKREEFFKEN